MLIKNALKEISRKREMVLGWKDAEKVAVTLKEKFSSSNGTNITLYLYWDEGLPGIHINIHCVRNMEDLKPILKFLGKNGYMHKGKPWFHEETRFVRWNFGEIILWAYFDSNEENACKFTQVGTKEIPVYKIDCPGLV